MNNEFFLTSISLTELRVLITEALKSELSHRTEQEAIQKVNTELITRKEAAKLLGISLPTLLEFTKAGKIAGYRIGTRIRYKRGEVIESLKQIQAIKAEKRR